MVTEMVEIHWVNQYGYCDDDKHPYKLENGTWAYLGDRTAIREFIKANGVTNYEFVCTISGCRWKSQAITRNVAEYILRCNLLPILEARRSSYASVYVCGYRGCESTEVEWHHYAPRNTFGLESDNFPCLPLCRTHHRYWHQQMDGYQWRRSRVTSVDCDCGASAWKGHQCFCGGDKLGNDRRAV